MSDDIKSLDDFLNQNTEKKEESSTVKIEDEFAKLLNDFINQGKEASAPQKEEEKKEETLDSFVSQTGNGLDSFITPSEEPKPTEPGTSSIATQQEQNSVENSFSQETINNLSDLASLQNITLEKQTVIPEEKSKLKDEEKELARAVTNFRDGIVAMAEKKNLKTPDTDYTEDSLYPNYKPSVGKKIAQYLLDCWDILNKYDPENMKRLSKDASDEEYLTFAESLSDTDMQLAIISYVEILINLEICEVSYEQKKEIVQKNRIKRELYEEYMELQERRALFIKKLKEKKFPINAEKLIGNYFKAAQKDAEGAYKALTKNPAMFSPIEFDKIHPKFFGLIKVTPEDGIKANQKIGEFIKKLKV